MNMEDFQCETFDIRISFTLEEFDKDAFLKAGKIGDEAEYLDEDGDLQLFFSFGSRLEPPKDHAHVRILIRKDQTGLATLSYHQAGENEVDREPPNLEDCAEWLGDFFRKDEVRVRADVAYEFGDDFSPAIPLPFPLVATGKDLAGMKVTGLALQYPEDHSVEHAILERSQDKTYLFLRIKTAMRLKAFDLFTELEMLRPTVASLVKEREKTNGGNKETSKA